MPDKAYSFFMILTQPITESQQAQPLWLQSLPFKYSINKLLPNYLNPANQ